MRLWRLLASDVKKRTRHQTLNRYDMLCATAFRRLNDELEIDSRDRRCLAAYLRCDAMGHRLPPQCRACRSQRGNRPDLSASLALDRSTGPAEAVDRRAG